MSWTLDQDRRLLRDSAQTFLAERAPVAHLRALRDGNDALGYSPALWREFGAQGYAATLVPEAHGGLGLGLTEAALIAEQIGHTLAPTPFLSTAVLAAGLLKNAGSAAQREAWLPRIAAGEAVLALAVDEAPRHRPEGLQTRATFEQGQWRIDGAKLMVVDGHVAEAVIVAAAVAADPAGSPGAPGSDPAGNVALLLVPRGAPGLEVERTVMIDAHNAARLRFNGVRVGADALLGSPAEGRAQLERALDDGRLVAAAELLGIADEVFERTVEYLKQRRQFERAIGESQALQHRSAELFCELELTRALLRRALAAHDGAAADAPLRVAQAKARAASAGNRAVQEAVQMHGGIGVTDELDIGLFMKRARVLQELFGDAAFQLDRAARLSGY